MVAHLNYTDTALPNPTFNPTTPLHKYTKIQVARTGIQSSTCGHRPEDYNHSLAVVCCICVYFGHNTQRLKIKVKN